MKIFYSILFTLFINSLILAQSYSVDWGPTLKKTWGPSTVISVMHADAEKYYLLMEDSKTSAFLSFNLQHKLLRDEELYFNKNKNIRLNKIATTKKGTYALLDHFDKRKKKWRVYKSDFDRGIFSNTQEIFSHNFQNYYGGSRNIRNRDNVYQEIILSLDSTKVAYTNLMSDADKKEEKIAVALMDDELNLLWSKEQILGYKDLAIDIVQSVVSNDGAIFVLGKMSRRGRNNSRAISEYKLFKIEESNFKEIEIDLGTRYASNDLAMYFPDDHTDEIILAGFYTDKERNTGIKGVFYASGGAAEGINTVKFNDFDQDLLSMLTTQGRIKRDKGLNLEFSIENFFQSEDGSISFIAEENFRVTSGGNFRANGSFGGAPQTTYHSNELIIPRFSHDGSLKTIQVISKDFRSNSILLGSYAHAIYKDQLFLIFNDYKSYSERRDLNGGASSIFTDLVAMNPKGGFVYDETIFSSRDIDLNFIPAVSDFVGDKFFIVCYNAKKYHIGILNLQND